MTWSRIQSSALATDAYVIMCENEIAGCTYHNNKHIREMYQFLEDTNFPYNEDLDWAIMFHDIVYDNQPEKEYRSKIKFAEMVIFQGNCNMSIEFIAEVQSLIMATQYHNEAMTTEPLKSAIIRADLHGLANPVKALSNFVKIMEESIILYNIDHKSFATNSIQFMTQLKDRVVQNKILDIEYDDFYDQVLTGIDSIIEYAKILKGDRNGLC
jgi:predicted metal-dependent HD superfamily phosphohydrolase